MFTTGFENFQQNNRKLTGFHETLTSFDFILIPNRSKTFEIKVQQSRFATH